jgi:biotin-dependent carboxylase-like uncharacterized protein
MIEIVAPGPLTLVQDLGRPGFAGLGVPRSGAFDAVALRLGNRLVGNPEGAAALEILHGGLLLRAHDAVTVALTGAPCPGLDWGRPRTLAAGAELRLGAAPTGMRAYLAVRGGIDAEPVLGSCSTDLLSGLGPPIVRAGTRLRVGAAGTVAIASVDAVRRPVTPRLTISLGPRLDWFAPEALGTLTSTAWIVRPESDRIGLRLDGPPLARVWPGELASEPALPGAVQVPPDGRPIVFGPDGPVTGGYPVIAVVDDLATAAQLRPGDAVRFALRAGE